MMPKNWSVLPMEAVLNGPAVSRGWGRAIVAGTIPEWACPSRGGVGWKSTSHLHKSLSGFRGATTLIASEECQDLWRLYRPR